MSKKPNEAQILIRLSPELCEKIKHLAKEHTRSLNGEVIWALQEYVKQQKVEDKHVNHTQDQA
jgi:hypothetical protein